MQGDYKSTPFSLGARKEQNNHLNNPVFKRPNRWSLFYTASENTYSASTYITILHNH